MSEPINAKNFSDEVTKAFDSVLDFIVLNKAYHRLNLLSETSIRIRSCKELDTFEWLYMIIDHEKCEYINERLDELREES